MKRYLFYIFLAFSFSSFANDCPLSQKKKAYLIKSSFYPLDNVECVDDSYKKWFISNKKFRLSTTLLKPQYFVESITTKANGKKIWHISNAPYLKKKKIKRKIASIVSRTESEKEKIHLFSAALFSGIASISSTDLVSDITQKAASDIGLGMNIYWAHLWTESLRFFTVASLKQFKFNVAEDREIEKAKMSQSYIGVGLNYKISNQFILTPGMGVGESIFLTSSSNSNLSLDKISVPVFSIGARYKLVQFKSGYTLDLSGRYGQMLPQDSQGYDIKSGSYYQIGIGSSYELNAKNLFISADYSHRVIEVNDSDQTSKGLGITAGVGWSY